jgi:NRPS condensation-like uncharacterized protein
VSNNFGMMIRVRGEVSPEQINAALGRIRGRHAGLLPADADAGRAPFPLEVRSDCGDDDWIATAQDELRGEFPDRNVGPLARFVMLRRAQGFDLVATFHHGASDGLSGTFLLRDLLQALADPQAQFESLPVPPRIWADPTLIPQAVRDNGGLKRRVALTAARLRARMLFKKVRRRFSAPEPEQPLPWETPAGDSDEYRFVILPARLSVEQTAALVARCKQEGVSVHAAVCAAWLQAFTAQNGSRFGRVSSPVNIRERLSQPVGETSGVFLAMVETRLDFAPERDFWQLARQFKDRFTPELSDERLFFRPLLFSKAFSGLSPADRPIMGRMMFQGPVPYDFSITNVGRVVIPERSGALQVEAFYGPLVNSSPYERTVGVGTLGGQLSMAYTFRKSRTEPSGELVQRVVEVLTQAAA